jgi:hypothetical protein
LDIVVSSQYPQPLFGLWSNRKLTEDKELVTIQGTNFYSVEETAKILGVAKKTLYNWKSKADSNGAEDRPVLRPVTAPNGRKFFREQEIIAVLSQCWGIEVSPKTLNQVQNLVHA